MPKRFTPDQAAALTLEGSRRAYQLLRHLDLGDGEGAARLLIKVDTPPEWLALGSALNAQQTATAKELAPAEQHRCTLAQDALHERLLAANGDQVALADWIFTSAKLALALKRAAEPEQAARLRFYESRARIVFDGEEPGSNLRHTVFRESTP